MDAPDLHLLAQSEKEIPAHVRPGRVLMLSQNLSMTSGSIGQKTLALRGAFLYRERMDLSTRNLEQALSIRRQIDALQRRLRALVGGPASGAAGPLHSRSRRRRLSASARAKIAAAARARWARVRARRAGANASRKGKRRKGGITAAGRRRLSELMKARWAARTKASRR